jgi:two-component system CheB/CheR fusion protein
MDYNYRKPGIRDVMTKGDIKRTRESILSNILDTLIDSAILVDNQDRIVEVYNDCSDYLHAQAGVFSNTVKSNMRKEITLLIHNIIRRLNKDESTVSYTNVSIKDGLYVTIKGDKIITKDEDYYLIQFIQPQTVSESYDANKIDYTEESNDRITQLENELSLTKENLQATVEELETSNEELQSSNEELIASNEELQSTNEELQSVNEELYSVNDEFQNKIEELTELNEDLNNLLINTDVAALYLDKDLRIRKKTPLISAITNIVDEDINRPINHITIMEGYPDMHEDIVTCSHTLKGLERQVEDDEGRTWYCKIKPYRKNKNIVEGIIITFVEITALVTQTTQLEDTNKLLDYVLEKTKLGWFRYHKKTDHFTTSKEMYCELGYTESEMPKTLQSFYKFIKKEDLPKLKKSIESLNKGKKDNLMMVVGFIQKDGSIINVRQSVEVIKDELFGTTLIIQAK